MVKGGANRTVIYTADESAGTLGTTALITLNKKISTDITSGGFTIDQNGSNAELDTFADTYAPVSDSESSDSGAYENGEKFSSITSNADTVVAIHHGPQNPADGKRKFFVHVAKLGQEIHAVKMEDGKYHKPQIKGEKVNVATIMTIAATYFPTSLYSTPVAQVVPVGKGFIKGWM